MTKRYALSIDTWMEFGVNYFWVEVSTGWGEWVSHCSLLYYGSGYDFRWQRLLLSCILIFHNKMEPLPSFLSWGLLALHTAEPQVLFLDSRMSPGLPHSDPWFLDFQPLASPVMSQNQVCSKHSWVSIMSEPILLRKSPCISLLMFVFPLSKSVSLHFWKVL